MAMVTVQVANLSHENFKSRQVMRWWLSRLSSRFGAKSSRERKPKWLSGLALKDDSECINSITTGTKQNKFHVEMSVRMVCVSDLLDKHNKPVSSFCKDVFSSDIFISQHFLWNSCNCFRICFGYVTSRSWSLVHTIDSRNSFWPVCDKGFLI